jgi:hypothetical protein
LRDPERGSRSKITPFSHSSSHSWCTCPSLKIQGSILPQGLLHFQYPFSAMPFPYVFPELTSLLYSNLR